MNQKGWSNYYHNFKRQHRWKLVEDMGYIGLFYEGEVYHQCQLEVYSKLGYHNQTEKDY